MIDSIQSTTSLNNVFVIEDDAGTREAIAMSFEITYPGVVVSQFDGAAGVLGNIETIEPDLITIDLGLPGQDGLSLIREIRTVSAVPIIVVSARSDDSSLVAAIRLGADAFLLKPISLVAIQAHVEAFVRLRERPPRKIESDKALILGNRKIDLERANVEINGGKESLTKIELNFLKMLAAASGRIVPTEDIKTGVWGDPNVSDSTVKMAVHRLRQKIGDDVAEHPAIVNHRSVGYSLVDY
jgi:DNA-binding response OmpR family regulator